MDATKWGVSFRPCLLDCLRHYSTNKLLADFTAGLTVGIVALPSCDGLWHRLGRET